MSSIDWKKMYQTCLAEKKELKEEVKTLNWKLNDGTAWGEFEQDIINAANKKIEKLKEENEELKEELEELKDHTTYLEDDNCRYANALEEEYVLKTDYEELKEELEKLKKN